LQTSVFLWERAGCCFVIWFGLSAMRVQHFCTMRWKGEQFETGQELFYILAGQPVEVASLEAGVEGGINKLTKKKKYSGSLLTA